MKGPRRVRRVADASPKSILGDRFVGSLFGGQAQLESVAKRSTTRRGAGSPVGGDFWEQGPTSVHTASAYWVADPVAIGGSGGWRLGMMLVQVVTDAPVGTVVTFGPGDMGWATAPVNAGGYAIACFPYPILPGHAAACWAAFPAPYSGTLDFSLFHAG